MSSRSRKTSLVVAAAVAASVSAFAPPASAADEPLPDIHYPPNSVRIPVILAGFGVFGAAYGLGASSARVSPDVPGSQALFIPIVGPWIALGQNGCAASNPDCGALLDLRAGLLVFEGIVQIAGLGLIAEGIFMKTEASSKKTGLFEVKHGDLTLRPLPLTSTKMTGLGFTGTF